MKSDATHDGVVNPVHSNSTGQLAQLASGRLFPVENPTVEDLNVYDICHQLAQVNRFSGACREPFSVAWHLVNCTYIAAYYMGNYDKPVLAQNHRSLVMWAVAHDIPEFILGDHIRPVKRANPSLMAMEAKLMTVVAEWLHLPVLNDAEQQALRWVDNVACASEREALLPCYPEWGSMPPPWPALVQRIREQASKPWREGRDALIELLTGPIFNQEQQEGVDQNDIRLN